MMLPPSCSACTSGRCPTAPLPPPHCRQVDAALIPFMLRLELLEQLGNYKAPAGERGVACGSELHAAAPSWLLLLLH